MKVEVNETLLKEFGRVYNAWNKEHGMEPVLDTRELADMAIAKAVMVMRERIEADTERKKYMVDRYRVEEYCNVYNRKVELEGKPDILKFEPCEEFANHAILVATELTRDKVRELEEQACTK